MNEKAKKEENARISEKEDKNKRRLELESNQRKRSV